MNVWQTLKLVRFVPDGEIVNPIRDRTRLVDEFYIDVALLRIIEKRTTDERL